jgi:hypothetical protein
MFLSMHQADGGAPSNAPVTLEAACGLTRQVSVWVTEWFLMFGAWVLFVDRIQQSEMWVGVVVSGLAVLGTELFRRQQALHVALPQGFLRDTARALRDAVIEDVQIFAALRSKPRFVCIRFAPPERGPRAAARRALAIILVSLSANSIVVAIDRKRHLLFLHQAVPRPKPELVRMVEGS